MTPIVILAVVWLVLLWWIRGQFGCAHEHLKGVANYYDHDLHCFIHLKECEDCGVALITHER